MKIESPPDTRAQALRFLQDGLSAAGIEEAPEEAARILEKVLGVTRTKLYLDLEKEVSEEAGKRALEILEKRKRRIPLAYLLGEAGFWKETLFVNEHCLIPRPETETMVEAVLELWRGRQNEKIRFLDLGTGSGAIAVSILREFPEARGTLLDISTDALEVARKNVEKYGLQDRAVLIQGDMLDISGEWFPHPGPLHGGEGKMRAESGWDLIVSNPPYLSAEDFENLQPEIRFEPKQALDGGQDGLDFYRKIIKGAKDHLVPQGLLSLEVGKGQSPTVSKWLQDAGYDNIQRFKDSLGIERVVIARTQQDPITKIQLPNNNQFPNYNG